MFITVSVDKDQATWKQSILSGKYSAAHSINLFTDGQGDQHPLLKFYNYHGFPQLLVIDKQGKIISANPPRPLTSLNWEQLRYDERHNFLPPDAAEPLSEGTKKFIALIDDHLLKDTNSGK